MKKAWVILLIVAGSSSFTFRTEHSSYRDLYSTSLNDLEQQLVLLSDKIRRTEQFSPEEIGGLKETIRSSRTKLKDIDIWLRYLDPVNYKKMNGPLPVEWENEVFEKFERPYKREGAGLTLAELYLNEKNKNTDTLYRLIRSSIEAINIFRADSVTSVLDKPDHFFFCNRLYLLNLASIYTTGSECPDPANVIPELRSMVASVRNIYLSYNKSFPATQISKEYLERYDKMISFVNSEPAYHEQFDHYTFIKNHVNPLFAINQKMIREYGVVSKSTNDYTLNNNSLSIFDKSLYTAQNTKGIYSLIDDPEVLKEIKQIGRSLFYDPILSGNNERSCASCHKPKEYFTDTSFATDLKFDKKGRLARNTPTLINVVYNHLMMLDGKHISLHDQAIAVMTNPEEMGGDAKEILEKVLSCKQYRTTFKKLASMTPEATEITMDHIVSAITYYYGAFSNYYAPFDDAMMLDQPLDKGAIKGFNLFMSKAKCATCHYIPQFNGVRPPYIGSEFEVLGTPADSSYSKLSDDEGRYNINPVDEMKGAFRTTTVRNAPYTKPYMHNGIFNTLEQVTELYDAGGGAGKKLNVEHQTLSPDPLKLTSTEKKELIQFINSLNERIIFEEPPADLPRSSNSELNDRKVGGVY